jgi:DNA polymerase-4
LLVAHFGQHYGRWLTEAAHGRDDRPIVTSREIKSVSRETTFERDLDAVRDRDALTGILLHLCERLGDDLKRKKVAGRTIGVKVRFEDFRTVTRDITLSHRVDGAQEICNAARNCLKRIPFDRKLRLLGIRIGSLADPGDEAVATGDSPSNAWKPGQSLPLFD